MSLWFVMPAHGRVELAKICMTQLRRTCDLLEREGVIATAVVIADDENLDTALSLGFGTYEAPNVLARKYNDGIQFACDRRFNPRPADYAVPIGSDDWVDHRLFLNLPPNDAVLGFRQVAFVAEDGLSLTETTLRYEAGVGIRVYPRALLEASGFRPGEDHRTRACDTSILWNTRRNYRDKKQRDIRVMYGDIHPLQIVDWKTSGTQMNGYKDVTGVHRGRKRERPFQCLQGFYPAEALEQMENHYRGGTDDELSQEASGRVPRRGREGQGKGGEGGEGTGEAGGEDRHQDGVDDKRRRVRPDQVNAGGLYRVVGSRMYLENRPGDLFEAKLDDRAEARAIGRGDIELLERITFDIQPERMVFPKGWLPQEALTDG